MFCGKCGKEIQNDFTFCPYCGEKIYHGHSKSVEERPAVKTTRDALDVQKVSDSRKARAIVTLILFIIGTAFLWHQNLFDAIKRNWDHIYLYRQYFKSLNPILHRVPHSQPGRCGLFLCGNRVRRPVLRPDRRRGRSCRVWLP